jgi:transposase
VCDPWFVSGIDFDAAAKRLTIRIDFVGDNRFSGVHPARDAIGKRHRHLNCFEHGCYLECACRA